MKNQKGFSVLWITLIIIFTAVIIVGGFFIYKINIFETAVPISEMTNSSNQKALSWQEGGVAIPGQFADAEIVDVGQGKFRMYYSVEPEVPNNKLELYSALSTDGKTWTQEPGVRKTFAVFPDVLKLSENSYRLYFQNAGVIKSAISEDGLTWQDEDGTRIDNKEEGFTLENVGAQSTTRLEDGTYALVYRGLLNEPYQTKEKLPNNTTSVYFWATSKDGLNFQKKGVAFDSRNDTLLGAADGGEWLNWDDGKLRVYFWSYGGVYYSVFENNKFSEPVFEFTNNTDTNVKFAPNPPADPTFANINNQWFMYYGQHTKGIYYATLK